MCVVLDAFLTLNVLFPPAYLFIIYLLYELILALFLTCSFIVYFFAYFLACFISSFT